MTEKNGVKKKKLMLKALDESSKIMLRLAKDKGIDTIDIIKIGKHKLIGGKHHNHFWLAQEWMHEAVSIMYDLALEAGRQDLLRKVIAGFEKKSPRCCCSSCGGFLCNDCQNRKEVLALLKKEKVK